MDLDTPLEMMSPSISLSTSLSSSTADVFSLLLTQLQQCHTQQITELEQKVAHLKKKCQKLMAIVKERGEIAVKYRQTCHQLREENHRLKKLMNREKHRIPPSPTQLISTPSPHHHHPNTNESRIPQREATKHDDDVSEPSRTADTTGGSDNSKKSRLALRKRNRKVRYAEVSRSSEISPEGRTIGGSDSPPGAKLFVPETMDPDLYEVEPHQEQNVANLEEVTEAVNGTDAYVERSKVRSGNSSTPLLVANVSLSRYNNFIVEGDRGAISPISRSSHLESGDKNRETRSGEEVKSDDVGDSSYTQMSPTFAGHGMLSARTSPISKHIARPGIVETPVSHHSKKSLSRTFDQTGESEASHLLLPQDVTPSGVRSEVQRDSSHLKRKSSPLVGSGKKLRSASEIGKTTKRKAGIVREFTFEPDRLKIEEQKRLRQSTLSQHLKPSIEWKDRTEQRSGEGEDFKVPEVPEPGDRKKRLSIETEGITDSSRRHDETNVSLSLNGSLDPMIDLDDYDRDSEHLEYKSSPLPKTGHRLDSAAAEVATASLVSADSRVGDGMDKSDLMFEDSFDCKSDVDNAEGGNGVHQDEEDDVCEILEIVDDFDRVPRNEDVPQFKHREVVRKHDEREKLKGFDCKQCAEFYNGMQLTDTQREERMTACSRHRGRYTPPSTPEHYWSIDFPDTPTCLKRGYIQQDDNIKVDANAMPRRRNRLKQLFPTKT